MKLAKFSIFLISHFFAVSVHASIDDIEQILSNLNKCSKYYDDNKASVYAYDLKMKDRVMAAARDEVYKMFDREDAVRLLIGNDFSFLFPKLKKNETFPDISSCRTIFKFHESNLIARGKIFKQSY